MLKKALARFSLGLVLALAIPCWGQSGAMTFLKKSDAERLEAFVLAENLVDFAARVGSARAYLMAAELRLLYPVVQEGGETQDAVIPLLERGRALAPGDTAVELWASQLRRLAAKSPRGQAAWHRLDVSLLPGIVQDFPLCDGPKERLLVVAEGEGLSLSVQSGSLVRETADHYLYFEADQPAVLKLRSEQSQNVTILYR